MESFKDIIIKIGDFFSNYGINIVAAILVFIIGYFLIKLLTKILMKIVYTTKLDNAIGGFIVALIYCSFIKSNIVVASSFCNCFDFRTFRQFIFSCFFVSCSSNRYGLKRFASKYCQWYYNHYN